MAKGTVSKGKKAPSVHSRAARRATTLDIDTDKSLKHVKPPQESLDYRPAVLAAHHAGGVTKKAKKGRKAILSSKARKRQEKDLDRAEAVMERTAKKIQRSKSQARVLQSRRQAWDEINKDIPAAAKGNRFAMIEGGEGDEDGAGPYVDTDEEMDAEDVPSAESAALPSAPAVDDDDEIS